MREKVAARSGPVRLAFTIGGFTGTNQEVQWRRGQLWYGLDGSRVKVTPSTEDWETFWATLDRIGVWSWEPVYNDPEIMDGCQWALQLRHGSRQVKSFGSNAYPGGNELAQARPFRQFLTAVGALVRQPLSGQG